MRCNLTLPYQDSLILSLKLKQAGTSSPAPDLALEYKYLTTEEERDLGNNNLIKKEKI